MTETTSPIDLEDALERAGGDMEFLKELMGLYRDDFILKTDELKQALAESDFGAVRNIGHYLKGSSANLSLVSLRESASDLEKAGLERMPGAAAGAAERLERDFAALEHWLAEFMDPDSQG